MIRCIRCNTIVATPGGQFCGMDDESSCRLRSERRALVRAATIASSSSKREMVAELARVEVGSLNWKAICWDFVNRLQLLASAPSLQKLADEGLGDDAAALRQLMALLREGPAASILDRNTTGRK